MTGFNHAASGGLIGALLPLPLAIPIALASHFALDMLPHYGISHHHRDDSNFWRIFGTVDAIAALALGMLALSWHRYAMFACGFVACSPDYIWVARVIRTRSFNLSDNNNWFTRWHANIQRYERPWGVWVELLIEIVLFASVWHFGHV